MNLYSAVVLETVVEVTVREMEQAKVPTEDRDPEMIREMTDMAVKHGATKAHDIWSRLAHAWCSVTTLPTSQCSNLLQLSKLFQYCKLHQFISPFRCSSFPHLSSRLWLLCQSLRCSASPHDRGTMSGWCLGGTPLTN